MSTAPVHTSELPAHDDLVAETREILARLGVSGLHRRRRSLVARSPITGGELARVPAHTADDVRTIVGSAQDAFHAWRTVPGPVRGQLVRELGELLREHKADLGALVSIEAGKIRSEGLGEVQEMIDICDLAVGLSRQLFGLTIASERPGHRMMEQWHPLGVVGVISAFNFPVAVWSWNAALAFVCGDPVVWKPSEKTLLTALACQSLIAEAARRVGAPEHISRLVLGGAEVGEALVDDARVALLSATGSTRMGRAVAPRVAARFGKLLLELGGNNAAIVTPSADLDLTVRGIVFSAAGTAGQRCTSLRRVIAHSSIADELVNRIKAAYETLPIGSPLADGTLVGPLIDKASYEGYVSALEKAQANGGELDRRRRAGAVGRERRRLLRPARPRAHADAERDRPGGDLRADPLRHELRRLRRCVGHAQRGAAGPVVVDLHDERAGGRAVRGGRRFRLRHRQRQHRARLVPRSAGRSAARRRPAAAASPARTPGSPTCAGRPTRSTTPPSSRSRRASSSADHHADRPRGRSGRQVLRAA